VRAVPSVDPSLKISTPGTCRIIRNERALRQPPGRETPGTVARKRAHPCSNRWPDERRNRSPAGSGCTAFLSGHDFSHQNPAGNHEIERTADPHAGGLWSPRRAEGSRLATPRASATMRTMDRSHQLWEAAGFDPLGSDSPGLPAERPAQATRRTR
jgi:hypothetical protein